MAIVVASEVEGQSQMAANVTRKAKHCGGIRLCVLAEKKKKSTWMRYQLAASSPKNGNQNLSSSNLLVSSKAKQKKKSTQTTSSNFPPPRVFYVHHSRLCNEVKYSLLWGLCLTPPLLWQRCAKVTNSFFLGQRREKCLIV